MRVCIGTGSSEIQVIKFDKGLCPECGHWVKVTKLTDASPERLYRHSPKGVRASY